MHLCQHTSLGLTDRSLTVTFDDNATPDASAPTVTVTSANDVDSEGTLSVSAAVSGGEYDTIAYAWDDGGAGGSFSAQAASTVYTAPDVSSDTDVTLTCTVTVEGDGTNAVDGTTDTATGTKDITVNAVDLMPTAPSVDDQAGFVGQVTSTITLPAGTGGDGTLTYALSGLPAGLSFSASNRQITGTPTTAGEYIVTYTVDDEDNDSDSSQFTYRIAGYDQSGRDVVVYAQIIAAAGADPYPSTGGETVGTVDLAVDDVDITIDRVSGAVRAARTCGYGARARTLGRLSLRTRAASTTPAAGRSSSRSHQATSRWMCRAMCTQERTRLICGWMSHQAIRLTSARLVQGIRSSLCFQRQQGHRCRAIVHRRHGR